MSVFALPALIALLFKAALFAYALRAPRHDSKTRLFMALLVLFSLHNAVEFLGFNHFAAYGFDTFIKRYGFLYFVIGIPFFAVLLHLSLALSINNWQRHARYAWAVYVPVPILEYLLIGTDKLVAGFQVFNNYTILRIPGPLYFLFETYAPLYLLATLVYLVYGARPSRLPAIDRIRNRYWLIGISPFVLLHTYLITANHFGLAKISASLFNPIAVTIFLIFTTYATHQYRLFDIEFYWPWSNVRKRKTAFYRRIQTTIAEIADLRSVRDILQCLADTLSCSVAVAGNGPRPIVAVVKGLQPEIVSAEEAFNIATFPHDTLKTIDHIVIAQEVVETRPDIHALMKQHNIAAIVPFHPHAGAGGSWLLLGNRFSEQVYSPLDFKIVEALFSHIGERFLDKLLLMRSQLVEATKDLRHYHSRLADAWLRQTSLQKELEAAQLENSILRARNAELLRERFTFIDRDQNTTPGIPGKTLDEQLSEFEKKIIESALAHCAGNKSEAARLLGLRKNTLYYKLKRLEISDDNEQS